MTVRTWFVSILSAVFLAAAVALPLGTASVQSHATTSALFPTLYVNYTDDCTFTIVNDAGAPVTTIPPGTYEVQVNTPIMFKLLADQGIPSNSMLACGIGWVQFQMTGPNIDIYTTLTVGCDSSDTTAALYFAPSSTFVAQDNAQPSVTRTVITTTATGSPTIPTSKSPNLPSISTSSGGELNALGQPIAGGSSSGTLGKLIGAVSASGALSLTDKGKSVATLPPGRYTISVTLTAKDKKSGFVVDEQGHPATVVAKAGSLGTHSATLTLGAGQWFYASTASGKKTYFIVTK